MILAIGAAYFVTPQMGSARATQSRAQCKKNLRSIYEGLFQYVQLHSALPSSVVGPHDACCPIAKAGGTGYVVNPALRVSDIGTVDYQATPIVIAHAAELHGDDVILLLTGDGSALSFELPKDELYKYREWLECFARGDRDASTIQSLAAIVGGSLREATEYWARSAGSASRRKQ